MQIEQVENDNPQKEKPKRSVAQVKAWEKALATKKQNIKNKEDLEILKQKIIQEKEADRIIKARETRVKKQTKKAENENIKNELDALRLKEQTKQIKKTKKQSVPKTPIKQYHNLTTKHKSQRPPQFYNSSTDESIEGDDESDSEDPSEEEEYSDEDEEYSPSSSEDEIIPQKKYYIQKSKKVIKEKKPPKVVYYEKEQPTPVDNYLNYFAK